MSGRGRDQRDKARTSAIGHRIRELRIDQDLTQEDLADRADVHRAVVGFIERGEREPGVSLVWRLAEGLGVSMAELMAGIEDSVPGPRRRR
jgi:transcriptional regulator with XRE-family HTH domain